MSLNEDKLAESLVSAEKGLSKEILPKLDTIEVRVEADFNKILSALRRDLNLDLNPRDSGYHITIITPPEREYLLNLNDDQLKKLSEINQKIQKGEEIKITGVGFLDADKLAGVPEKQKGGKVAFLTVESSELQEFRKSIGLPEKDFHITLGFVGSDIHQVLSGTDEKGEPIYKTVSKKPNPAFEKYLANLPEIKFGVLSGNEFSEELKKPKEYIDLGGKEKDLPTIGKIMTAIESGENFQIVGGGGSGKTENLLTALYLKNKESKMFDLRQWTISHLAEDSVRQSILADQDANLAAKNYLTALQQVIDNMGDFPEEEKKAKIKGIIKKDYLNDKTLGIKYAENRLISRQYAKYQKYVRFDDGLTDDLEEENTLKGVFKSTSKFLIFDEFDMGIGDDLAPIEVETAKILLQIAKDMPNKQIAEIIHPPARGSHSFMEGVKASGEKINEIEMDFIPREFEELVLKTVGIEGEQAQIFMEEIGGLPIAYLKIMTDPDFKKDLINKNPNERIALLRENVEKSIRKNKKIIFEKEPPRSKAVLVDLAQDKDITDTLDEEILGRIKRTMYVTEKEGRVFMPPIVKKILLELE